MPRLALGLLLVLTFAVPAAAQQPGFGERVEVEAVLIDVIVTDSAGNQILGLTKDDLVVRENGVLQTIDSVDYITSRRLLTGREENLPFSVEHVKEERFLIFFFDKPEGGALFQHLARARAAVNRFIDNDMGTRDMVAIAGHDVRLKVFSDFTSDKQQLKRALREAALFSLGETKPPAPNGPSILRDIDQASMMSGSGTVYQGITVLAEALRKIRGRKNLVVFSPGILEPGETVRDGMILNTSRFYEPMVRALNASNVSVYAANLLPNQDSSPVYHQTLERMTAETNGEYFRYAVSFDPVLAQVEKATGGYYLLTYRTQKPRGARGYQKVEVSISNPEFRVKARPGYLYGETN
ncbi:MAG TPA: VWA domain-containing protein [Thermoanaerobaculia bacterium]|nr:VWA domain-containing protein [Thermoanaerobaculia bacterium]